MDRAPNHPSSDTGATPLATGLSPTISAWDEYYREASRRRRAAGGDRQFRVEKRRRLWRERIGIGLSAVLVGTMTMIFYLVLR
jgi:hypothetical protein